MDNDSAWNNPFLKLLRWLAFIPIGLILANILLVIPIKLFHLCFPITVNPPIVRYLVAFFVVMVGLGILYYWAAGSFMVSVLVCRWIAPNRRIASVLYTIVIVLAGLATILFSHFLVTPGPDGTMVEVPPPSVWLTAYFAVFFLVSAIGAVYSGRKDE